MLKNSCRKKLSSLAALIDAVIDLSLLNKIDLFNGFVSIHHQNIRQPAIEMLDFWKVQLLNFLKGYLNYNYKRIALQTK